MIQFIGSIPGIITLEYYPEKGFIVFNWESFHISLEQIKELFPKALDLTLQGKAYYYIAETSKVTNVLPAEVVEWWGNTWVPKLVAAGLKGIITVVAPNALTAASNRIWHAEVVNGIVQKNVNNIIEARLAIKALQAGKKI